MITAFSTSPNRIRTLLILVIGGLVAIAAVTIGISDNPPGILLAFLAAAAIVFAFVHPWRTSRQFRRLLFASIVGFVLFIVLHNVFEAIAHNIAPTGVIQNLLQVLAVVFFLLATMICPAAFIIGIVGLAVVFVRSRRQPS